MTGQVNAVLGVCVAVAGVQAVSNPIDALATVSGVGLMIWLTLRKDRECVRLREENHALREEHARIRTEAQGLSRELGKRCSDCKLAVAANKEFIENHAEHETMISSAAALAGFGVTRNSSASALAGFGVTRENEE